MLDWVRRIFQSPRSNAPERELPPSESDAIADDHLAEGHFAEGERAFERHRWDDAAKAYAAAIDLRHDWGQAHHRLGLCMHRLSRFEEACDCFELALHFQPGQARVYLDRAYAERKRGQNLTALASVREALSIAPPTAEARNLEGALLLDTGDAASAIAAFEHAVELDPRHPDANSNLGHLLFRDRGQYERGARHIEQALELAPQNLNYLCNYTMVLMHRGELERVIELCDRLIVQRPEMEEVRLNRGLARLKLGHFGSGWPDYEARKRVRCNYLPRDLPWLEWQGEDLRDKTILIYGEQGLGDEIMFASCFLEMTERAHRCVIECEPRLKTLFRRSFPSATVVGGVQTRERPAWMERVSPIDVQVAAGSLPLHLRRTSESFPMHSGYLKADPVRRRHWRAQLDRLGPGQKIGISWRGGMQSTRRALRSIDLAALSSLFGISRAHFIDLQYGDSSEERARLSAQSGHVLHSWPEMLGDLDELAALVAELDLVISVCTAVIHLAGALGRDVWVLVPSVPEWRYQAQGTRMPWYPSLRMFRQREGEDWSAVLNEVSQALHTRLESCDRRRAAQTEVCADASAWAGDENRQ